MKNLIALLAVIALPVTAQTTTVTTETTREESTVVTVVYNDGSSVTEQLTVPVVYKCNGQNCIKP